MTWAKFDDRYPWHRKVRQLSDAAFRLDVSAICWCAENLTNGVIDGEHLPVVSDVKRPRKAAEELVRRGRWHEGIHDCETCPISDTEGFVIHDYLAYNPTREKVEEEREKRRKAGALGGVASGQSRANAKQSASGLPSTSQAPVASSPTNPRTRTRSLTPTTSVQGGSHVSSGRDPNEPPRCSQHKGMKRDDVPNCWACGHKREQWEMSRNTDAVFDRAPWCGDDECNPMTRQRETPFGVIRCPECHPLAEESA